MTQTIPNFSQIDQDAERRRTLAKVYSLLIRLVEEAEIRSALVNNVGESDRSNEVDLFVGLELSLSETKQTSDSAPL